MDNGYLGSKATAGLCQAIIALMPPHSIYIESHLGSGAIMKRKPAAQRNIGIDQFSCEHPVELVHWSHYAGRDLTDRQRIKRRARIWSQRYIQMPHAERLAVLSAIMAVEAELPMATVSRETLNGIMVERYSGFAALEASGKVTPEISALFEALFAMMQMLIMLLLEKRARKTPPNTSLPCSLAPFDKTTAELSPVTCDPWYHSI